MTVNLDKKAREWAAEKGYNPAFGARPLKRFLWRNIETKLARALISNEVTEGSDVKFTVKDDELVMKEATRDSRMRGGEDDWARALSPPVLLITRASRA